MKSTRASILLSVSLILIALLIFTLSFIRESSRQIQSRLDTSTTLVVPATAQTPPAHTDYQLPEPGILPIHPLYSFKMIRDRLQLLLFTRTDQKAQRLLHFSDKRLAAAHRLINQGLAQAAISTAIKGELYLGQAIDSLSAAPQTTQLLLLNQFQQATLKHEEIIEILMSQTQGETHNQAAQLYQQLGQYRSRLESISNQPFPYPRPEDYQISSSTGSAIPATNSATPDLTPYL